jgi:nucleoid-associated protein YgaU
MISFNSRYRATQEIRNGKVEIVATYNKIPTKQFITYLSRSGDSFEKLSRNYLGNPTFYWRIAEINPHVPFPDQIPVGTRIRIPQ